MDVEARLARLQRRMELEEVMRHQIRRNTPVEVRTANALAEYAEFADNRVTPVPAVAAVYQILMAVQPILHRYPGLTLGIWPSPPDESAERVLRTAAMIVVDPSHHTLSLELPLDDPATNPGLGWPQLVQVTQAVRPEDDAVDTASAPPETAAASGTAPAASGTAPGAPETTPAEVPVNGAGRSDAPAMAAPAVAAPAGEPISEPISEPTGPGLGNVAVAADVVAGEEPEPAGADVAAEATGGPQEPAAVSTPHPGNGKPDSVAVQLARILRGPEEG